MPGKMCHDVNGDKKSIGNWQIGSRVLGFVTVLAQEYRPIDRSSRVMIPLQDGSAHLPRRPLLRSGLHPGRALFGHRRPQHSISSAPQKVRPARTDLNRCHVKAPNSQLEFPH
jgi:hypothetical protein